MTISSEQLIPFQSGEAGMQVRPLLGERFSNRSGCLEVGQGDPAGRGVPHGMARPERSELPTL